MSPAGGMPSVFSIGDDILIEGYNEQARNHDAMLENVLRICRQENVKLNKDKCLFMCPKIPFFGEVISQQGVDSYPRKIQALAYMLLPKPRRNCNNFYIH